MKRRKKRDERNMIKFGKKVVKLRVPILIISFFLLIPSAMGYLNTRINYDILSYLPKDIETMQGQDILLDEFQKGAYAILITEGIEGNDLNQLEDKIADIDGVAKLISYLMVEVKNMSIRSTKKVVSDA